MQSSVMTLPGEFFTVPVNGAGARRVRGHVHFARSRASAA
jgi:hypothetical protein